MAKRFIECLGDFLKARNERTIEVATKVRDVLQASDNDFMRRIDEITGRMDEEQRVEFINDSADEQMLLDDAIHFFRKAMFIAAYAEFEDSLKWICRHACKLQLSNLDVPARGFHIGNAKDFLLGIDVNGAPFSGSAFGAPWVEIDDGWRPIRNTLVHDNGVVETEKGVMIATDDKYTEQDSSDTANADRIRDFIQHRSDIEIVFGQLRFESDVGVQFIEVAQQALDEIVKELVRIAPPSPPAPPERPR